MITTDTARCETCGNSAEDDSTADVCLQGRPYAPVERRENGRVECQPCHDGRLAIEAHA